MNSARKNNIYQAILKERAKKLKREADMWGITRNGNIQKMNYRNI